MTNDLTTTSRRLPATAFGNTGVALQSMDDAARFAEAVFASGMAPNGFKNPQAVLVAMQAGMELGLTPMKAIQSVAVINGRPTIYGDALLAIARASGLVSNIAERIEGDGAHAVAYCCVTRTDGNTVERSFSMTDAKTAGLAGKSGPWMQFPKRMLQMRARGFALRDAVPEALCGFSVREELEPHIGPDRAKDITPSTPDPIFDTLTIDTNCSVVPPSDVSRPASLGDVPPSQTPSDAGPSILPPQTTPSPDVDHDTGAGDFLQELLEDHVRKEWEIWRDGLLSSLNAATWKTLDAVNARIEKNLANIPDDIREELSTAVHETHTRLMEATNVRQKDSQ